MVIAMGVLIVLTVGGILAYNGIQHNSRTAATLAAAKSVYTAANAYDLDNSDATAPEDAATEYNDQGQEEGDEPSIKATVNRMDSGALCAVATYTQHEISEVAGARSVDECLGVEEDDEEEDAGESLDGGMFVATIDVSKSYPTSNATCAMPDGNTGTQAYLPIGGSVDVTVDWDDGVTTNHKVSDSTRLTYCYDSDEIDKDPIRTVKVDGTFTRIGDGSNTTRIFNQELISIDHWGETGTTSTAYAFYEAKNLTSVVAPPKTVTNMRYMFYGATDLTTLTGNWNNNVANVANMSYMFYNTPKFNQDISDWNVDKVTIYGSSFRGGSAILENAHTPAKFH